MDIQLILFAREFDSFSKGILGKEVHSYGDKPTTKSSLTEKLPGLANLGTYSFLHDAVLKFEISNEDEDAGQSFLPYLDGSPITFDIPSPVGGIELYHYTNNDTYGGFVRPNINSLDYRKIFKKEN